MIRNLISLIKEMMEKNHSVIIIFQRTIFDFGNLEFAWRQRSTNSTAGFYFLAIDDQKWLSNFMAKFSFWKSWTSQEDLLTFWVLDLIGDLFSLTSFVVFPGKVDLDLVLVPVLDLVLELGFGLDLDLLYQFFSTIDFVGFWNLSSENLGI